MHIMLNLCVRFLLPSLIILILSEHHIQHFCPTGKKNRKISLETIIHWQHLKLSRPHSWFNIIL
ncbi:hypothetical protein GLYMA_18G037533v4 [Glycine max]|nr:hypothetical protein GLYMA_18G037533v4 [Glycine max]KAH1153067.1 hypothetical protein GYH30_048939 [Glycine max]